MASSTLLHLFLLFISLAGSMALAAPPYQSRSVLKRNFPTATTTSPSDADLPITSATMMDDPTLPPPDRRLSEQMNVQATEDGILPECYKKCMRSESGKAHTDIEKLTVAGWCYDGTPFDHAQEWLNQYVLPCVKYECVENLAGKAGRARAWMRDTCGPEVDVGTR